MIEFQALQLLKQKERCPKWTNDEISLFENIMKFNFVNFQQI